MRGRQLTMSSLWLCFFYITLGFRTADSRKLFMMLVDGFRWDYFRLPGLEPAGFSRLIEAGVKAEYMVPDFPTNSFPNYRTIETGLHVESHGIVGNYIYDEETGGMFELGETPRSLVPRWWQDGEAFYISAEKQGYRTALYHWRGCQVVHEGVTPSLCIPWSTAAPTMEESRWAMLDGLQRLKNGSADIVYVYHEQVDRIGHLYGPDSKELLDTVQELDGDITDLLDNITEQGLGDVNVIIVSDHGMTSLKKDHVIDISQALDMSDIREITEGGTQTYIWPVKGKEEKVFNVLRDFSRHYEVYNRAELTERWFLKNHKWMSPILLVAEKGWFVYHTGLKFDRPIGNHGFDNTEEDMRSIFLAHGPDFKSSFVALPFSNVNVYQLVCHVTGVTPRPHNGTWDSVKDMMAEEKSHSEL